MDHTVRNTIWRHRHSGERYAVRLNEEGNLIAAAGPLHYLEIDHALAGDYDDDPPLREWITDEEGVGAFTRD